MMLLRGISEFGAVVILAYHPKTVPVLIYERFEGFGLHAALPVAVILILTVLVVFCILRGLLSPKREEWRWISCYNIFIQEEQLMKISARNVLRGTVKKVVLGAVNCEVTIALPDGTEIVSIITNASAESLGLEEGKAAYAVIKASNVMIAVD